MTLIAVYNSDGCVGRCDAKCYNAECAECDCICGGHNHGAGLKRATENTQQMADEWIQQWKKTHPGDEVKTNQEVFQLSLF